MALASFVCLRASACSDDGGGGGGGDGGGDDDGDGGGGGAAANDDGGSGGRCERRSAIDLRNRSLSLITIELSKFARHANV